MFAARVLALTDDLDRAAQAAMARAFQLLLLLHVFTRTLLWTLAQQASHGDWQAGRYVLVAALGAAGLVTWRLPRYARQATWLALLVLTIKLAASFPTTSNHFFIEFLCMALLALCNIDVSDERALLLSGARWLTLIVFFWSGVQKVLYGTYFDGAFLGYSISTRPSFATLFAWAVPAQEIARLQGLREVSPGAGPYALQTPLALLMANGVYVFEMLAPVLLLIRRTRTWAAVATMGFVFCIEAGALELMFGALFLNLLLLFLPRPLNRTLLPGFAALYAGLVASRLGILPRFWFN
ncbi:MAG: hypothetical protein ABI629_24505 [bacterium]